MWTTVGRSCFPDSSRQKNNVRADGFAGSHASGSPSEFHFHLISTRLSAGVLSRRSSYPFPPPTRFSGEREEEEEERLLFSPPLLSRTERSGGEGRLIQSKCSERRGLYGGARAGGTWGVCRFVDLRAGGGEAEMGVGSGRTEDGEGGSGGDEEKGQRRASAHLLARISRGGGGFIDKPSSSSSSFTPQYRSQEG